MDIENNIKEKNNHYEFDMPENSSEYDALGRLMLRFGIDARAGESRNIGLSNDVKQEQINLDDKNIDFTDPKYSKDLADTIKKHSALVLSIDYMDGYGKIDQSESDEKKKNIERLLERGDLDVVSQFMSKNVSEISENGFRELFTKVKTEIGTMENMSESMYKNYEKISLGDLNPARAYLKNLDSPTNNNNFEYDRAMEDVRYRLDKLDFEEEKMDENKYDRKNSPSNKM